MRVSRDVGDHELFSDFRVGGKVLGLVAREGKSAEAGVEPCDCSLWGAA